MTSVFKFKEEKGRYTISTVSRKIRTGPPSLGQDEDPIVREYRVNKEGSRWRLNRIGDTCGGGIIFGTLRQAVKYTARYGEAWND